MTPTKFVPVRVTVFPPAMHRSHGYAGEMLSKSRGWSFAVLMFGELKAQRARSAAGQSNTVQQAELEEAARLVGLEYKAAFDGIDESTITAGRARLDATLGDVSRRAASSTTDDSGEA